MKTIVVSVLALGAMTSVALAAEPTKFTPAGPVDLTDAQMDGITAGQDQDLVDVDISDITVAVPVSASVAANVLCIGGPETCGATSTQDRPGRIDVQQ